MNSPDTCGTSTATSPHRFPSMVPDAPSATSMATCSVNTIETPTGPETVYGNPIGRGNLLTTLIQ